MMAPHVRHPAFLELALKKQRLQLKSAALRADFASYADGMRPALACADRAQEGVRWLRRHPQALVAAAVALAVARPRAMFRWARRGLFAWQAARKVGRWLGAAER